MNTMVRVWNKNEFEYKERFKGNWIIIAPKKCIEMDYEEAVKFLGQATPILKMKDGRQDPKSYKWLQIDPEDRIRAEASIRGEHESKSEKVYACMKCNKEFKHKKALLTHIKEKHYEDLASDEDKEIIDDLIDEEPKK